MSKKTKPVSKAKKKGKQPALKKKKTKLVTVREKRLNSKQKKLEEKKKTKRRKLGKLTKKVPEEPGLYAWTDSQGQPTYIGKSNNIKRRVKEHLKSKEPDKDGKIMNGSQGLVYKVVQRPPEGNPIGQIEKKAVRAYKPPINNFKFY